MAPPSVPLLDSYLPGLPKRSGKVRDIYDLGETLILVSTDRISAFDFVLPHGIPDKGRVLTQISRFWFHRLNVTHHVLSSDVTEMPLPKGSDRDALAGRTMWVRKTRVVPIECVVRGYLAGSGWKEYQRQRTVCGAALPAGLQRAGRLPEPIFTPATKAETGHDENISVAEMARRVGSEVTDRLEELSLNAYREGADYARERGILIADTKFEWGWDADRLILIDEVMTPDSSRFWPADTYRPGSNPPSFDKQFVRDWLEGSGWDKQSPPPQLPVEVIEQTRTRYIEAFERLSGESFAWK